MTTATTIPQPRMKNPGMVIPEATNAIKALVGATMQGDVPQATLGLVHLRASQVNGCSFCVDSGSKHAKQGGETDERLFAVAAWRESPYFTDAERAALALAESRHAPQRPCRSCSGRDLGRGGQALQRATAGGIGLVDRHHQRLQPHQCRDQAARGRRRLLGFAADERVENGRRTLGGRQTRRVDFDVVVGPSVDQVGVPARLSDATVATITLALLDHLDRAAHSDPQDIRADHDGLERECLVRSSATRHPRPGRVPVGTRTPEPLGGLLQSASQEARATTSKAGTRVDDGREPRESRGGTAVSKERLRLAHEKGIDTRDLKRSLPLLPNSKRNARLARTARTIENDAQSRT